VYNVYNTKIDDASASSPASPSSSAGKTSKRTSWFGFGASALDPRNNMPAEPNQRPAPGQRAKLSVDRERKHHPEEWIERRHVDLPVAADVL
jgi:hypothetical protein